MEELLSDPFAAEPAIVDPVEEPLVESVDLSSFLEDEPDFAFVEDDLDPEAVADLLLSLLAVVEEEVEPEPELLFEEDPVPLVLLPPPLLLLLLLEVLPDDVDALGELDELPDEFEDSFEF